MAIAEEKLKQILVKESYVSEEDIKKVTKLTATGNRSLVDILLSENLITKDILGQAIAESFGIDYYDLNSHPPTVELIKKIPEDISKNWRVVLVSSNKKELVVATDNPEVKGLLTELKKIFSSQNIKLAYSLTEDINASLMKYCQPLDTRFSQIIKESKKVAPEILEEIFGDAFTFRASDIHFEPQAGQEVIVRFRVDGVLQEAGRLPKEYYENILNRIKVQSRLRIDEHFAAQDGSMRFQQRDRVIDLRTSIMPTVEGEKIVLRLLSSYIQGLALLELGLSVADQSLVTQAASKPFGMMLVTGPTGSGKTTTLYSVLRMLNRPDVNITTIEDPVEYKIQGINQIQVNPQTNLTFSQGLRSIVRQDPDIILVGEIRDNETAEIAVNAALTGHLMLSTFHANDAATAIPRLLDMGIEPFLLASTLEIIIAQRLVRKICESCRRSILVSKESLQKKYGSTSVYLGTKKLNLYTGKGCTQCQYTGYHGRTAIFEIINVTTEIQNLILKNPATQEITNLARSQGGKSLFEDGIAKVRAGITTMEELLRVAQPPKI